MTNFIELHLQDGSPLMYNVAAIVGYFAARQAAVDQYGYRCHVVTSNCGATDVDNVKESYDEITAKIKKCTGTMVII